MFQDPLLGFNLISWRPTPAGWISLETPQQKRASSRVEGRISWFFSSCGRKLGVPLELQWGPQGPARVASGKASLHASCEGPLGILLQLLPGPRSSSGAEARTSGFLSSAGMDLGGPLEFPQVSLASSHVEMQVHFPLELEKQCQDSG